MTNSATSSSESAQPADSSTRKPLGVSPLSRQLSVSKSERVKALLERMHPILVDRYHVEDYKSPSRADLSSSTVEKFLFNTFGYELESHYYAPDTLFAVFIVISFRLGVNYAIGQDGWSRFCASYSDAFVVIGITALIFVSMYWIFGGIWTYVDIYYRAELAPYKIQPGKYPTSDDLRHVAFWVIRSQILIGGLMLTLFYYLSTKFGVLDEMMGTLPHPLLAIAHIVAHALVFEVWYYFTHRLGHHHKYYKYVHKVHHKYEAPFAIMALYAHPVEEIFINFLPALGSPLLFRSHVTVLWTWLTLVAFAATRAHCGYGSPYNNAPVSHDLHHRSPHGNFGQFDILDAFFGTDKLAKTTIQKILEIRKARKESFENLSFEEIERDFIDGVFRVEKDKIRRLLAQAKLTTEEVSSLILDLADFFPEAFIDRIEFACERIDTITNNDLFELFHEDLSFLYPPGNFYQVQGKPTSALNPQARTPRQQETYGNQQECQIKTD